MASTNYAPSSQRRAGLGLFPAPSRSFAASTLASGVLLTGVALSPLVLAQAFAQSRSVLVQRSFVASAVRRSGSAVVTLETSRTTKRPSPSGLPRGMMVNPLFRHFFLTPGETMPRPRIQRGQGSGVLFDPKGLLLTNAHVVEGADQLIVGLSDGRRVRGSVIGKDSFTDLAVVRLDGGGKWPTAPLGDSDRLNVGDWAIAVGNPYGLENTVTLGIISNLNRNVSQLGISGKRLDLIQTDAAINPGNSGGPLLNAVGEVIGINTLVRSGPGAGLGFAIPINRARAIAAELVATGKARHPVIGIGLSKIPAKTSGAAAPQGAVIRSIQMRSPAAQAGLRIDDVITAVDGQPVEGPAAVVSAIERRGVGEILTLQIRRGDQGKIVQLKPVDLAALASG
ncbi:trypsin-like peptidase domain-containing protein [Synechococcus sp. M16CYN]|uniref:trypsin-like peptidase domain-containing protein n=1 Tax=Synechococcus sp. M16CYN TaxID=3103139 RepID=UPI00333ECC05